MDTALSMAVRGMCTVYDISSAVSGVLNVVSNNGH